MSSKQTYPKFNIYIYIYIKENYMTLGQKKKKKKPHFIHKAHVMRRLVYTIYKRILYFQLNFYVIQKYSH